MVKRTIATLGSDGKLDSSQMPSGAALPPGGTAAQVLTKLSSSDGDADWADPTGGGGGNVDGGSPGSSFGGTTGIDGGTP